MLKRLKRALNRTNRPTVDYPRVSSFPFLSGDTFRLLAGTEFLSASIASRRGVPDNIAFAKGDLAAEPEFVERLREWAKASGLSKRVLLIHNSDVVPSGDGLSNLRDHVDAVYCVNAVTEADGIFAVPIGLENAALNRNGRLTHYLDGFDTNHEVRTRRVLSSFHTETNPSVREPVRVLMEESRFGYQGFQWKLGEYRDVVRTTKFVICPPGNGIDTHRTWEAIYLGAVPVVLGDAIGASLLENPILPISRYEEFLAMTDQELDDVYLDVSRKPAHKAYAPYWVKRILESAGA